MQRVFLFLATNLLVMVAFTTLWSVVNMFYPLNAVGGGYYTPLLIFFFIWGLGGSFLSLYMSKWIAKKYYKVRIVDQRGEYPEFQMLVEKVHSAARRAGLTNMPEVGVYESPDANAFATGSSRNNALVAVSTGLLQVMDDEAVEGVLAHEVAHIANGDMVTMALIQGVINAFVLFFSRILADIVVSQIEEEEGSVGLFARMGLNIAFQVAFGFLGMIVVGYFSRIREYRADLGAAKTVGKRSMIKALQALQTVQDRAIPDKGALSSMKISSPASWFGTHPSLEKRIARLELSQY